MGLSLKRYLWFYLLTIICLFFFVSTLQTILSAGLVSGNEPAGRAERESEHIHTEAASDTVTHSGLSAYATTHAPVTLHPALSEPVVIIRRTLNSSNFPEFEFEAGCKDKICSNFVSVSSWSCAAQVVKGAPHHSVRPTCRFRNGSSEPFVLLRSFPGSGNTWTRQLLERATEICTGSTYCDGSLWKSGMVGEGVNDTTVLTVKTHERKIRGDKTIFIMRNPIDAVASFWKWYLEYNQVWKGKLHRSNPPERFFRDYPEWNTFVERKSLLWVKLVEFDFLSYSMNPVLLVRYEDLKENATREVLRMLDFLRVKYSPYVVQERLRDEITTFKRPKATMNEFDPYTPYQRELVYSHLGYLFRTSRQHHKNTLTRTLESYMSTLKS